HQELVRLLGGTVRALRLADQPPTVILLVGLHGAGKTTTAGKLAIRLVKGGRRPLLVATDLRRPAAVAQLAAVGQQTGVPVFSRPGATDPVAVATAALAEAKRHGHDVVIIDSAGRQHIDDELMAELVTMRDATAPHQVLLVVDAMTGQDAVNIAQRFHDLVGIDGLIVTKLDGDARGGAMRPKGAVAGMDERALRRVEAMIDSMTPEERTHPHLIDGSRRRRIARGSGTTIQEVNRLLRQFDDARTLMKQMSGLGKKGKLQFPLP